MGLPKEIARPLSELSVGERGRLEQGAFRAALSRLPERDRSVIERLIRRLSDPRNGIRDMGEISAVELVAKYAIAENKRSPR